MKRVEINEIIFKKLIDGVKHCVSKGDSRPMLQYIQIKVKTDTITAYALDGYRAGRVEIKNTCPIDEEFTCYIKPLTVKVSKRGINPVVVECVDEKTFVEVMTEYGVLRYGFDIPNGEFFDIEKVYAAARPHDRELGLSPRYVIDAMKALNGICLFGVGESCAVFDSKKTIKKHLLSEQKTRTLQTSNLFYP